MGKIVDSIKEIQPCLFCQSWDPSCYSDCPAIKDYHAAKEGLMALEIILSKKVNIFDEIEQIEDYKAYLEFRKNYANPDLLVITEEQFNLIKKINNMYPIETNY